MSDTFKTYLFSYEHAGSTWVQEIKASSPQDAQARARKLHAATLDGEMVAKLTMPTAPWRNAALKVRRLILGR
jgi:hypothetical protein